MLLNEYCWDMPLDTGEVLGSALEASLVFLVIICWHHSVFIMVTWPSLKELGVDFLAPEASVRFSSIF